MNEQPKPSKLKELVQKIASSPVKTDSQGNRYLEHYIDSFDCVRYQGQGLVFQENGLKINPPTKDQVLLLTTAVSLCGTDLEIMKKARQNQLPNEAMGKVVGHEAAGIVVGLGAEVRDWQIGQLVCLDSHFACSRSGHEHFDDCVASGKGCDGIVGGIRGAMDDQGQRLDPPDGYWSQVISVPASALPLELPIEIADSFKASSTLESLGNIYMMVVKMKELGLLEEPQRTLCVVVGLGATGYPMAAVASHHGLTTVGINPSTWKQEFAIKNGACQLTYPNIESLPSKQTLEEELGQSWDQVLVIITTGDDATHQYALDVLEKSNSPWKRKMAIIFGLFADPKQAMPHAPSDMASLPQRDFVFSRHEFKTPNATEVYGVCGRNLASWRMLFEDLQTKEGKPSSLVETFNQAYYQVEDGLAGIGQLLNQGQAAVQKVLTQNKKLKVVANLISN